MTFKKILMTVVLILAVCGIGWLAAVDVPVAQQPVVKTIPNDQFFKNHAP
jgi:hypothetical protein